MQVQGSPEHRQKIAATFPESYATLFELMPKDALPQPGPHGQHSLVLQYSVSWLAVCSFFLDFALTRAVAAALKA